MIGVALLWACLAAAPEEAPVSGDCSADAGTLVAEAEAQLAISGAEPSMETLANLRRLVRAARRTDSSTALALRAADLAFVSADPEEGADLLAAVAEARPVALSPPELLLLAVRAGERRRWREAIVRYEDLARALQSRGESGGWVAARVSDLELEEQAEAIAPPGSGPSGEARLALADGKRALAAGRLREARASLHTALALAPSYVEALLALASVEMRAGRSSLAIRACREALAAEPERVEALTMLANLLWEEPDRKAKEESLALLDRAAAVRPDLRMLLRLSAGRWAEYGDAPRARERLDRFLARATPREREEAQSLRDALSRPVQGAPEQAPHAGPPPEEPASAAVDRWRKAQVYAARGDADSLQAALGLLAQVEQLDPAFARAPELAAAIREKRGEWKEAEDALNRAIRADPSRATGYESLARILDRNPARAGEAAAAWSRAEEAGSTEALFHLAQAAERAGSSAEALRLYRRYRDEAPAGLAAVEGAASVRRLERRRAAWIFAAASAASLLLVGAGLALYRRRTGSTFAEWLSRDPSRAAQTRRIIGRLRHEALKHGGMLLADAADRLERGDVGARRATAELLETRLYSEDGSRGLVAEAEGALASLQSLARAGGDRLNLAHRDPLFSWLVRGLRALRRGKASVLRMARTGPARERDVRRVARLLRRAAQCFQLASGTEIERELDLASALSVRLDALSALLARVASEANVTAPSLEPIGELAAAGNLPQVCISPSDWETLWRNLFANALAARRLGLSAAARRDPITAEGHLRIVLADDLPGALTTGEIHARASDRGWGVVVELLRRNEGAIEVVPAPAPGFTKGIAVDLPLAEGLA